MFKKTMFPFMLIVVLTFFVSCFEAQENALTNLEIMIENPVTSRTIMPSDFLMEVQKYSVSGSGSSGASFGPVLSSENIVSIQNIPVGSWNVTAKALNAENNELAEGSETFIIKKGGNKVTVVLDSMTGTGTLQLDFKWDEHISDKSSITITLSIEDSSGNKINRTKNVNTSDCRVSFLVNLSAGSHVLNVQVYDSEGNLGIGATDAIRIVSNSRSTGTVELKASKPQVWNGTEIKLENKVGSPMKFYVDYYPKNPVKGQLMTLTSHYHSLPEGVSSADLKYQWYKDGVLQADGVGYNYAIVSEFGIHRYDVIVRSGIEGTMCGASLLLNISD
ncbi:MAG: hypothetical protein ACTTJW_05720 [Sphaerochaeta sp.]